jgi:hypothetical protein
LKKAAQKLLRLWAGGGEASTAQFRKVFCFFFSKEALPFLRNKKARTKVRAFFFTWR